MSCWIPVEKAVLDLLNEYGLSIEDLLISMESEGIDVYSELIRRIDNCSSDVVNYIYGLPWKTVALLLFTIQSLYIINPSGLYKGCRLYPLREEIVVFNKVDFNGLIKLITRLKKII